ncbi:hypothetical protein CDV36_013724 [Fusarium kuroshium]|uniref:CHK kinase-like domain-containing protein n=1 Tax=Fusarium kuroshium TaxID=2010991 RepID=A0A3M2RMV6_9HYPO|nr:hypothetical protein CDV36_013724 [Fusarium kuroshium]
MTISINAVSTKTNGAIASSDPLPLTTQELTPAWFTKVLGRPVKDASIIETIHGTASKILVKLTYEDPADSPTAVCVKGGFNPAILALQPSLCQMYQLEAEFYHYIGPTVQMRLPDAHYCAIDEVRGQGIVVLADLKTTGYAFGNPLEAWTVDRVRAGVEQLAILHAKTWGGEPRDFPWLNREFSIRDIMRSLLSAESWEARFGGESRPPVPNQLADRERMAKAFETLWSNTDTKMNCIVHGDPHIGNTFITPTGEPGFLDWQCIYRGSAIHDVTYFIAGSLFIDDRRENEGELFQHYLDTLHQKGGPRFSQEELWEEYRKHTLHGFIWSLALSEMQPRELVDSMARRYCAAIMDLKTLELLEGLE